MGGSVLFSTKAQDWALVGVALVLFVSPWLLHFVGSLSSWCAWFIAIFIAYFGIAASFSQGEHWEEWLTAMLGLILLFLPGLLAITPESNIARSFWLFGALTTLLSIWAHWLRHRPHPTDKPNDR